MEELYPATQLCYPGKGVELRFEREHLLVHLSDVDDSLLRLSEALTRAGGCEVVVVFLGEHYQGRGNLISGYDGVSVVAIDEGFHAINARSAPRVAVDLAGTYYLRPPALGVPMTVLDISVTGLAIEPLAARRPMFDEHRMCGFDLDGREIKAIIAFVEIDEQLWRARFVKLGLSDEDAIASFVLSRQLTQRRQLSSLEVRSASTLDVEDRLRFPLVEGIDVGESGITFTAIGAVVAVSSLPPEPSVVTELMGLVGWLRCGDLRDLDHALRLRKLSQFAIDLVLTGCLALTAYLAKLTVVELLARLAGLEVGRDEYNQFESPSFVPVEGVDLNGLANGAALIDDDCRCWVQHAYAVGVSLYFLDEGGEHEDVGRVDPLSLVALIRESDRQILLVPRWGPQQCHGVSQEIYDALCMLAVGPVLQLKI